MHNILVLRMNAGIKPNDQPDNPDNNLNLVIILQIAFPDEVMPCE
jgi:hypothetical protein